MRLTRQPNKPSSQARANVDSATALGKLIRERYGCDPFEIMAKAAMGDVVGLGLMTDDELERQEEISCIGKTVIHKKGGRDLMRELLPASVRIQAAKELASYIRPKLAATMFLGEDGKPANGNVLLYVPDNGRRGGDA